MPHLKKIAILWLVLFGLSGLCNEALAKQCQPSLSADKATQLFWEGLKTQARHKNSIAILPFFDNSTISKDPLLASGMAFALYDILAVGNDNIYHPYISQALLNHWNVQGEALRSEQTAMKMAEYLRARFVLLGSVQRTIHGEMRFFISIYDHKIRRVQTPIIEFATLLNDSYFANLKSSLEGIRKRLKLKSKAFKGVKQLPKLQAFRYYTKGMEYAGTYNEGLLKVAQTWFEKALRETYHNYPDAALNLARVHFMQALIYRMSGRDPSQHWIQAQNILNSYGKANIKKPSLKEFNTVRFVNNQDTFSKAWTYYKNGRLKEAGKTAAEGLAYTPEDGQLFHIYQLSGGKKAPAYSYQAVCF